MAVTHFVTQIMHVSRHFGVYSRKQKKLFRENGFENVVSDLKENSLCVQKTTFRKKWKKFKKNFNAKLWKRLKSLADFGDKTTSSGKFLRPHFQTVFPKQSFLFSILNSKLSWNIGNLRPKLRNGQNLPHECPNFTNHFFKSNFTYNFSHVSTSLTPHYQNSFL